jgi:GTP-binding protein Era
MSFKSGFVTIIGRPNVGKSTILNALTKEKIAITSNKPQTTRNTIKSVITGENHQVIIMDTPGIHKPKNELGKYMVERAQETLTEVDCILFVIDNKSVKPTSVEQDIIKILKGINVPIILVINKVDLFDNKSDLLMIIDEYNKIIKFSATIPTSAINGDGLDLIMNNIIKDLPTGPKYFPDDTLTDQPERNIMAEIIREKMLNLLRNEIPFGIGVEIISYKEKEDGSLLSIQANIYCEKASHKSIIIGKKGSMLKNIGKEAREEMERLMGIHIYLELWVKVKIGWRNNLNMLKTLGYK